MTSEFSVARRRLLGMVGAGLTLGTVGAGTANAAPGRYIVGTATARGRRVAEREASAVSRVLDFGRIGHAVAGTFPDEALKGLRRRPDVRYVEPDGLMHAIQVDATDAEYPWGVDRVDAEAVHGASDGEGAHVAVIDTGIDSDHPDLPNVGEGVAYVDASGSYARSWDDDNGHGTHCAGIAAAARDGEGVVGVAPGATLHAVKVLDGDGAGYLSDIAAGIRWTADRGYDVASMSLGGGSSSTVRDACQYAYESGVLLVAAAGNSGCASEYTVNDYSCDGCVAAPAVHDTVVAVSSTASDDSPSSFSSAGCTVELAAPGSSIKSTYPGGGYETFSGTSMACPHVSGAAALLMAGGLASVDDTTDFENPGGARQRLRDTAERRTHTGKTLVPSDMTRNNLYGYGLLDVEAAVDAQESTDTTAPSAPTNLVSPGQTDTTVDLTWDASSDDTGVDHYAVYVDGAKWSQSADTTTTVTGLSAGTTYDFAVTAVDAAGNESASSGTLTVATDAATGAAPTVVSFDASSGSPNNPHAEVEMTWQVSDGPDAVTLELYDGSIEQGESPLRTWNVAASGSQSYAEKFASPRSYTARLVASNADGTAEATDGVSA